MNKNAKILIVDDSQANIYLISSILEEETEKEFETLEALNGESALKILETVTPDVILLDLMMPGMDGWQVCKETRKFSNVPILVLSALDDPAMIASALDAGADDYLVKPVSSNVLVAHINKLIRRTGTLEAPNNSADRSTPTRPIASTS